MSRQQPFLAKQGGGSDSSLGNVSREESRSRPPETTSTPKVHSSSSGKVPPELKEVADLIGGFIEYWGFKSIHGRIWVHLFTSKHPLDATTLVKRLKVSKALVSFAVRDLLEHEVIHEVARGPRGTVLLRANPDLTGVITGVLRKRERLMLSRIRTASSLLETLPEEARNEGELDQERLRYLNELTRSAESLLEMMLVMAGAAQGRLAPVPGSNGKGNVNEKPAPHADLLQQLQRIQGDKP